MILIMCSNSTPKMLQIEKTFPVVTNYFHECVILWHNACFLMMFCEFHLCEHFLPITGLFAGTFSAPFISAGLFMVTVIVRTFSRRLTQKDSQK